MSIKRTFSLKLFLPLLVLVFLTGWGVGVHLHLGQGESLERVFGDRGDGYFNFFVLEHVRAFLSGEVEDLSNAHIFWPDHDHSFWWSDNLIVPGVLHAVLTGLVGSAATSAYFSGVFWVLVGFGSTLMLLNETFRTLHPEKRFPVGGWGMAMVLLAYLAAFSSARLYSYNHFQNLASVLVIAQITFALRYLREPHLRNIIGVVGLETALLFFSPYQAMLGIVILSAMGFCIFAHPDRHPLKLLGRHGPWVVPFLIPVAWIFRMYSRAEPVEYLRSDIALRSVRPGNIFLPSHVDVLPKLFPRIFNGGYLGAGLLLFTLGGIGFVLWRFRGRLKNLFRNTWGIAWFVMLALSFVDAHEIKGLTVWFRLFSLLTPFVMLFMMIKSERIQKKRVPYLFLALSCVLVFGVSLGPVMHFQNQALDPGIWGWYQHGIPGFGSMRELIRFVPTAQLLLMACLFGIVSLAQRHRALLLSFGVFCLGLQAWEQHSARPKLTYLNENQRLTEQESELFASMEGSMLVVPMSPFHRNTLYLLFWRSFPDLNLVNGYSGRSSEIFDRFMELEQQQGRASQEVMDLARSLGVEWICLYRPHVEESRQKALLEHLPLHFRSERFLVFSL